MYITVLKDGRPWQTLERPVSPSGNVTINVDGSAVSFDEPFGRYFPALGYTWWVSHPFKYHADGRQVSLYSGHVTTPGMSSVVEPAHRYIEGDGRIFQLRYQNEDDLRSGGAEWREIEQAEITFPEP